MPPVGGCRAMAGARLGEGNMAGFKPQLTQDPCPSVQPVQLSMVTLVMFNTCLLR